MSRHFLFDTPLSEGIPPAPEGETSGVALWTRAGYLLSGALLVGMVLAGFNPQFPIQEAAAGFHARAWPWEVLVNEQHVLVWTRESAFILVLSAAALCLFIAMFLRSPRARTWLAFGATALVGSAVLPPRDDWYLLPGFGLNLMLSVLAAGAATAAFRPRPAGALHLAFMGVLVSAALLLLPLPKVAAPPGVEEVDLGYRAIGPGTVEAVVDMVRKTSSSTPVVVGTDAHGRDLLADRAFLLGGLEAMVPQLCWCLGCLLGLLVLLRLGGRWSAWALGLVLLLATLLPCVLNGGNRVKELRSARAPAEPLSSVEAMAAAAQGASDSLLSLNRLLLLPLALALTDLLRPRRTTA